MKKERNKFLMKKFIMISFLGGIFIGLFVLIVLLSANLFVYSSTKSKIYSLKDVPTKQTILILGARVYSNGTLSPVVQERTDTAIDVYRAQKGSKILVSGDHGTKQYDEVNTIRKYLLDHGIPAHDIFLDHAGFDTYDSLYRAKSIFEVQSVIITTEAFHLSRALFIAQDLGIDAVGVEADRMTYNGKPWMIAREKVATVKAMGDVILHSQPKFLGEQIPITGDSRLSWDQQ